MASQGKEKNPYQLEDFIEIGCEIFFVIALWSVLFAVFSWLPNFWPFVVSSIPVAVLLAVLWLIGKYAPTRTSEHEQSVVKPPYWEQLVPLEKKRYLPVTTIYFSVLVFFGSLFVIGFAWFNSSGFSFIPLYISLFVTLCGVIFMYSLERGSIAQDKLDDQYENVRRERYGIPLPISGTPQFVQAVKRVLQELQERAPEHYKEVIEYLPKAEYVPHRRHEFAGRSDGLFSVDGSERGYEYFRWVFIHELGHCVKGHRDGNWTEEAANSYAHMVIAKVA